MLENKSGCFFLNTVYSFAMYRVPSAPSDLSAEQL